MVWIWLCLEEFGLRRSAEVVGPRRRLTCLNDKRGPSLQHDGLSLKPIKAPAMNHHQRKVLHAIFAHPVNANLDLQDVTHVLTALGAEIDSKTKSRLGVTLNGRTTFLHLTNHSLLKAEVIQVRKFMESCGITAGAFPL